MRHPQATLKTDKGGYGASSTGHTEDKGGYGASSTGHTEDKGGYGASSTGHTEDRQTKEGMVRHPQATMKTDRQRRVWCVIHRPH